MLAFNFLLFGSRVSRAREMVGEFLHLRPEQMREPVITHQLSYKNLLPLNIRFLFGESPPAVRDLIGKYGVMDEVLVIFDVDDPGSFVSLTPTVINGLKEITGHPSPMLVGYDAGVGSTTRHVPTDKVLTYAQSQDFFYYFEVTAKSKYDFRTLFKRLIKETIAVFRQNFPEQYDEEVKEARRAAREAAQAAEAEQARINQ